MRQRDVTTMGRPAFVLRPATDGDLEFIHGLRISGMRQHVESIWGWDNEAERQRFEDRFAPAAYRLIVIEGQDVGAVSVEKRTDEVFLADIEIGASWRGKGVGTTVLNDILRDAADRGHPVRLQVLRGNLAQHWYASLGFEVIGETATHVTMRASPAATTCVDG